MMPRNFLIKLILLFLAVNLTLQDVSEIKRKQNAHIPKEYDRSIMSKIADMNDLSNFNEILDNILITRVVGTENHKKVRNYIVKEMQDLKWSIELDEFDDSTPNMGVLTFTNIVAKLNKNAERYLVLACHYDSKYFPNEEFLGATDSAVPCAMLLNMAKTMSKYLDQSKSNDLSLMFIFFDGEEAFLEWSDKDSIYGARHLAKKYEDEGFLHKMDMLVLLDLLGAPDPEFYSLNPETLSFYLRLEKTENDLGSMSLLKSYTHSGVNSNESNNKYFLQRSVQAGIEDDHIPFMRRNVKILHLIPLPFPTVWHKIQDDRKAIDLETVENLMKILRIFIAEYLHISSDVFLN